MKILILALILVLPIMAEVVAQAQSQTTTDPDSDFVVSRTPCQGTLVGFLNIPWASSMETVRKLIQDQGGFTEVAVTVPNLVLYKGGTFANLAVHDLQLSFFHNQLMQATVTLKTTDDDKQTMSNLRDALTQKYGSWYGTKSSPCWKFQDGNVILLDNSAGSITISYFDTDLSDAAKSESSTGINPSNL
jgi:hypothetical protein